jgi:hypothetical protein
LTILTFDGAEGGLVIVPPPVENAPMSNTPDTDLLTPE